MDQDPISQTPSPTHAHTDPLSGESGAHPVGAGVGAAGGAAALAAIGSLAGPVGTAVGIAVGAVLGGLAGKGFAEGLDPTMEEAYWRQKHPLQPYADPARRFEDYVPAYRTGYTGFRDGQTFEEQEAALRQAYESAPPEAEAGAEPRRGTMEYNLSTMPLHDEAASDAGAARTPGSMEDNLSVHPLAWSSARAAARAAYERVEQLAAARRAREMQAAKNK